MKDFKPVGLAAMLALSLGLASNVAADGLLNISVNPAKALANDFDIYVTAKVTSKLSLGVTAEFQQPLHFSLFIKSISAREAEKFGFIARYHSQQTFESGSFFSLKGTYDQVRYLDFSENYDDNVEGPIAECRNSLSGYSLDGLAGYSWHTQNQFSAEAAVGFRVSSLSGKYFSCDLDQENDLDGIPDNGLIADVRIGVTF